MTGGNPRAEVALSVCFHASQLHFRVKALGGKMGMLAPGGGSAFGVLKSLSDFGPATVPGLARMRPVSRQHIQTIVNHLLERGLVRTRPNPRHRRSRLVAITGKGQGVFDAMLEDALLLAERLSGGLDLADLKVCDTMLGALGARALALAGR